MKIYILLPVHNRKSITIQFVECLQNQTYKNWHLVLIDDGSIDGTAEIVEYMIKNDSLSIIKGKGDWWWGGSLHRGYLWVKKNLLDDRDLILLINDDVFLENNFIENAINIIKELGDNQLLKAITIDKDNRNNTCKGIFADWLNFSFKKTNSIELTNCVDTNGLFIRIKDFILLGGFYPKLLPHYLSDYEYTIRAFNKGYRFFFDKNVNIIWNLKTTTNTILESEKNRWIFIKKYFSKHSSMNPTYWLWFVILSCPKKFIFQNVFIVIKRMIISIYQKKGIY